MATLVAFVVTVLLSAGFATLFGVPLLRALDLIERPYQLPYSDSEWGLLVAEASAALQSDERFAKLHKLAELNAG